jgi:hypothetical protein
MSETLEVTPKQWKGFLSTLAAHDARHNLCAVCFSLVILVDGQWLHNRKGYDPDHQARPGSKLTAGCRAIWPEEEIIVDPFMAPREPSPAQKAAITEYLKHPRRSA